MDHRPSGARTTTILVLIMILTAACGAAPTSTPAATPGAVTSAPEATETADPTPVPTGSELALPDGLTFESIGKWPVTAVASFDLAEDGVAISIGDVERDCDNCLPTGYAALLLEGACAEHTEPDFEGAIDTDSWGEGKSGRLLVGTDQLGEILASPHSILLTDGPGYEMLACANIGA